jgi:hypothetical protein
MAQLRNAKITLDHAHGKTLEALGVEYGLNKTRIFQIYRATLAALGLKPDASPIDIGLAVQRRERASRDFSHGIRIYDSVKNTPEWFYGIVDRERFMDEEYFLTRYL